MQETVLDFFFANFYTFLNTHSLDWEMEHEVVDIAVVMKYWCDGQFGD